ncbi:MAG: tRNA pseudouridine(55) synthase TruB [Gammaproteobacteria bacterium]|nr:tRNA pseudouridine(55) synthase TruB [Gammaproteobacteria bacterium]
MTPARLAPRAVHGILLLDKPPGITSNAALQRAKRLFRAAKAGHTGSLDPLATGLLPICFGEATKLCGYLLAADKRYVGRARLGVATTTGDAEGEPVAQSDPSKLTRQQVEAAAHGLLGEQQQVPPMYSAVKRQGRPLYRLAREGIEVERRSRPIRIHALSITGFGGGHFDFDLRCSKGTYVRTLIEDLAALVGQRAHLVQLRRLELDGQAGVAMVDFGSLDAAAAGGPAALDRFLLPPGAALAGWPQVTADPARAFYLQRGQAVRFAGAPQCGEVAVVDIDGKLLAIGEIDAEGLVAPRRLLARH